MDTSVATVRYSGMSTDVRYSEEEGRRILARAAERQEAAERARLQAAGALSLDELTSIADEVGIDPTYVEAAAKEVELRRDEQPVGMTLGLPNELREVRMLPGSVSDRQWYAMVEVLREAFGRSGIVTQFGAVREWASANDSADAMPVKVRIEPTDGGTLMSMSQSTKSISMIGMTLGGVFAGLGGAFSVLFAMGEFESGVWALPIMVFILAVLSIVVGAVGGRSFVRRRTALMDSVANKIELIGRPEDTEEA